MDSGKHTTQTVNQIVEEHRRAMDRFFKGSTSSPAKARALLIKLGILNKSGKRLAARYR